MTSDRAPLDPIALRRKLSISAGMWISLQVVEETGSTNADLVAAAHKGAPPGTVLAAERQHAGQGRLGRGWHSPPRAGIAVSVLLRPGAGVAAVSPSRWGWLPLLAGVATVETMLAVTGLQGSLKWPNDVLIDEHKCAGILAEAAGDAVVLGIGLNVTTRAEEMPQPTSGGLPATSLRMAGAVTTDREVLLVELLRRIERWYQRWYAHAGDAVQCGLHTAYLAVNATLGRPVKALLPGGQELRGEASTVDPDGRLVLRGGDGATVVGAGDIHHLDADEVQHLRVFEG